MILATEDTENTEERQRNKFDFKICKRCFMFEFERLGFSKF
jgi:hypothetical protein